MTILSFRSFNTASQSLPSAVSDWKSVIHLSVVSSHGERRRKWQPAPGSLSRASRGQSGLAGCCLWAHTTEATEQQPQQHVWRSVFLRQLSRFFLCFSTVWPRCVLEWTCFLSFFQRWTLNLESVFHQNFINFQPLCLQVLLSFPLSSPFFLRVSSFHAWWCVLNGRCRSFSLNVFSLWFPEFVFQFMDSLCYLLKCTIAPVYFHFNNYSFQF